MISRGVIGGVEKAGVHGDNHLERRQALRDPSCTRGEVFNSNRVGGSGYITTNEGKAQGRSGGKLTGQRLIGTKGGSGQREGANLGTGIREYSGMKGWLKQ